MSLTKAKKRVLDAYKTLEKALGYPPTTRKIASFLGKSSPATIHEHLAAIRSEGLLAKSELRVTCLAGRQASYELPLMGLITAGQPIEAVADGTETVAVPAKFVIDGANSYVLKVKGTSMIEDGIYDGDYVIVERNPSPKNGDVVVALLDNAYATLKRFYREIDRIRLQPANRELDPIFVRDVIIQGVVRGVIRQFI